MLYTVQADLGDYSDALEPTLKLPGMDKVVKLDWNGRTTGEGIPWVGSGEWEVEPVDLVVTFRNYHNFGYADRMKINKSTFDALKPGGVLAVWSSSPDRAFSKRLLQAGFEVREHVVRPHRAGKGPRHHIWIGKCCRISNSSIFSHISQQSAHDFSTSSFW